MNSETVRVELAERSYDILFDKINSPAVISAFTALPQKNVLICADSNTSHFLPEVKSVLQQSGKTVYEWVFPAGESSKNMDNAMKLCGYASSLKLGRNTLFAALGGGVTGDLTGFAAAIYMRGVDFIQIPTSLLAMVDSSVGGKTAVDTAYGKNLAGAFHQPKLVVINCGFLRTLPAREIGSGMAEILKTAMILDHYFAQKLAAFDGNPADDPEFLRQAVKRSCEIKAAVVAADEKESGDSGRVFLNYGHTFGHAIEHLSHFKLAHGEAVAVGMDIAAFAAVKLGLCPADLPEFQYSLLKKSAIAPADFPASAVIHPADRIVELMKGDKKNGDGRFRAVLPLAPGRVKTVDLDPDWTLNTIAEYFKIRFISVDPAADDRLKVSIIGLGLLGSSLAQSIDQNQYSITLWNRNPEASNYLLSRGCGDWIAPSPEAAFTGSDLVILALPMPIAEEFIGRCHHLLKPGAVLTDIGSVKSGIIRVAENFPDLNFVGSHPMAGTEKSGFAAGFKGLYDNADVFIVPGKYSSETGIQRVENFWKSLHTHTTRINCFEHDALVAHTSHMLHIIASALTSSILERDDPAEQRRHYAGCATGFRDTSRIASSSPEMWKEICMANSAAILPALDEFQSALDEMRQTLIDGDGEKFAVLFARGKNLRDSWLCYKKSTALPQNIVLCGIKHSGKTTVGRQIAALLDIPFADSDDLIIRKDGGDRTIREIFTALGEESFRKLEADVIAGLAASPQKTVISLGGGALSNPFVSGELKSLLGFKVWLNTDDKTAFDRICANGLPPFLADENDPFAAFVKMNDSRRKIFSGVCDTMVVPSGLPRQTALAVLSCYSKLL